MRIIIAEKQKERTWRYRGRLESWLCFWIGRKEQGRNWAQVPGQRREQHLASLERER